MCGAPARQADGAHPADTAGRADQVATADRTDTADRTNKAVLAPPADKTVPANGKALRRFRPHLLSIPMLSR
ncbi:hypothetical protein GCM10009863_16510 [Streptomyces axinellae]|uniref:Uncharacterized protein n=1 Tax=Streptomyces axinellae TaxID=552788 RepID=A0ABN3PVT5_9ACTN